MMSKFQVGDLVWGKNLAIFNHKLWIYEIKNKGKTKYQVSRFYPKSRSVNVFTIEDVDSSCIACPNMIRLLVGIEE